MIALTVLYSLKIHMRSQIAMLLDTFEEYVFLGDEFEENFMVNFGKKIKKVLRKFWGWNGWKVKNAEPDPKSKLSYTG